MKLELTILQLYPKEMNSFGDSGNLLVLTQRLHWRDIATNITAHKINDNIHEQKPDIILCGSGQVTDQLKITDDWQKIAEKIFDWIETGVPILLCSGLYQMLGETYQHPNGPKIRGAKIFDIKTIPHKKYLTGNVTLESEEFGRIVGYEHHTERTFLSNQLKPLGKVLRGSGNNGRDSQEGLHYQNLIATNLRGPILARNPKIADFLIKTALERKYPQQDISLSRLDDSIEIATQEQLSRRPR